MDRKVTPPLPASIEIIDEPGRRRYRLPPRQLGKWRMVSLGFFAVAAFALWQLVRILRGFAMGMQPRPEWHEWGIGLVLLAIGSFFVLVPLSLGLAIAWGRREIEIRGARLRTIERAGPFWRSKRLPIARLSRLSVLGVSPSNNSGPPAVLSQLCALLGELNSGKRILLAPGFSHDLLASLAIDLAKECERSAEAATGTKLDKIPVLLGSTGLTESAAAGSDQEEEDEEDFDDDELAGDDDFASNEVIAQPSHSRVTVEHTASGVTYVIPAAGLRAGSKGLFAFGLIWCIGVGALTALFVLSEPEKPQPGPIGPLVFLIPFWFVGVALLLGGLNMGLRRAAIAIVGNELMLLQTSIFRSRTRQWTSDKLVTVQSGPSGMEVNNRPVIELQIIDATGNKCGLLAGRDERELEWLASEIRRGLKLSRTSEGETASEIMSRDFAEQPRESRIACERFPSGFSMTIPPAGVRGSHGFVGFGLTLLAIMAGVTAAEIWWQMSIVRHPFGALATLAGWGVALAILLAGINLACRRGAIAVAKGQLLVTQSSLFGSKRGEFAAGELTAVRAAPAGMGKDFEGLVVLQVVDAAGEKHSFLSGLDKHELFWIATLIRQTLDVPAEAVEALPDYRTDDVEDAADGEARGDGTLND